MLVPRVFAAVACSYRVYVSLSVGLLYGYEILRESWFWAAQSSGN